MEKTHQVLDSRHTCTGPPVTPIGLQHSGLEGNLDLPSNTDDVNWIVLLEKTVEWF